MNARGDVVADEIEIGDIPTLVLDKIFVDAVTLLNVDEQNLPEGVLNAPSLISEINDKIKDYKAGQESYVINLTLLPQTEQDLNYLSRAARCG